MSEISSGRVLVVGLGFIGSHLAEALIRQGVPVRLVSRSGAPPDLDSPGTEVLEGDAADPTVLEPALEGVEHVVWCAGGLVPAASHVRPVTDLELTLPPLIAMLEALKERPGTRITLISSGGTVYGRPARIPVDEDHPTDPITSYGILKLATEKYAGMYSDLYGIPVRILRCSNAYGERQPPDRGQGVVAAFLHRILRDEPVVVFGDGSVVRDYLYVGDLVSVILGLMRAPGGPSVLNVGSGRATSLKELIGVVEDVTGRRLRVERRPGRPFDVPEIVLDVTRLRGVVNFSPLPLPAGVRRTWAAVQAAKTTGAVVAP